MKIKFFLFFSFIVLIACNGDDMGDEMNTNEAYKLDDGKKITICHKGEETINISINALQAHLDHGDIIGDCNDNLVCHWEPLENTWTPLLVADEELQFHIDHGDFLGECDFEVGEVYTYVPDPAFEQALIDKGYDSDGYLNTRVLTSDISGRGNLIIPAGEFDNKIEDLTGIQDFIALRELNIRNHSIQVLDLSQNINLLRLFCENNDLNLLNIANNKDLERLYCTNNNLLSLNISQNKGLTRLYASNNMLTALDLSQNSVLERLYCEDNQLTCIQKGTNALASLDPLRTKTGGVPIEIDCGY